MDSCELRKSSTRTDGVNWTKIMLVKVRQRCANEKAGGEPGKQGTEE